MSALEELPGHLAPALTELFKGIIGHPDVYANHARVSAKISDIRLCVENAISTVLSARNEALGRPLGLMALPNDTLLQVSEYLPLSDVFSASRVCRRLRAVTLSCSRLWSNLEIRASHPPDEVQAFLDEDYAYEASIVSNMALVDAALQRSNQSPLSLKVTVTSYCVPFEFINKLESLLTLVAPRLWALHIRVACDELIESIFGTRRRVLPQLRELVISRPEPERFADLDVNLAAMVFPGLTHLEHHAGIRLVGIPSLPNLKVLRCHVEEILEILPILNGAPALESVACAGDSRLSPFSAANDSHELLAALNAVPDLCFTAHIDLEEEGCEPLRRFVDCLLHPQLQLDLVFRNWNRHIWPRCDRILSATQLAIRDSPKSIDLLATDAAGRSTTVRVMGQLNHYANPRGEHTEPVDWSDIPSLDSLNSLRVDASIWRLVMAKFPRAPRLADLTLSLDDGNSLESLRSPLSAAMGLDHISFEMRESLGVPQALRALGADVHFDEDDQTARPMPPVPAGTSLTISSGDPISIDGWCVGDVMDLLGVEEVKLDGVVLEGDRAFAERALSH